MGPAGPRRDAPVLVQIRRQALPGLLEGLGPQAVLPGAGRRPDRAHSTTGRPTMQDLPYLNLDWGSVGVVVAIGWPGSWSAELTRDRGTALRLSGGMNRLDLALRPGEEIRSPLIALQFWKGGDWVRAQ